MWTSCPLTGTHQGAVGSKNHRRVVIILGPVSDLDSLHESYFARRLHLRVLRFKRSERLTSPGGSG